MIKKNSKKNIRFIISLACIFLIIPALLAVVFLTKGKYFAIISIAVIICAIIPFILFFENRQPQAKEIVPVAVMSALAIASRAAFYFLPQFKPLLAIIIITGVAFGCESGFLSGALCMLCSNFIFGHGPWTPWQMFAAGLIGFVSGLFGKSKATRSTVFLILWGIIAGFLFGFIVDSWSLIGFSQSLNIEAAIAVYLAGFLFNVVLVIATAVFLALTAKIVLLKLERVKIKYGLYKKLQTNVKDISEYKEKE